jgi:hypothetical protein
MITDKNTDSLYTMYIHVYCRKRRGVVANMVHVQCGFCFVLFFRFYPLFLIPFLWFHSIFPL